MGRGASTGVSVGTEFVVGEKRVEPAAGSADEWRIDLLQL